MSEKVDALCGTTALVHQHGDEIRLRIADERGNAIASLLLDDERALALALALASARPPLADEQPA